MSEKNGAERGSESTGDILARAIQDVVGEATHQAAHEAVVEAVSLMRQVPEVVRRQLNEALEQHGVRTIPHQLSGAVERVEAVAEKISVVLEQGSESDRAHLEKTLQGAVTDLKQEVSHAVVSLTKSLATANTKLAQMDTALNERLSALAQRQEAVERAVADHAGLAQVVQHHAAALDARFTALAERMTGLSKHVEASNRALEHGTGETMSVLQPHLVSINEQLGLAPAAIKVLEHKLDGLSNAVRAPAAMRALEQRIDALEQGHAVTRAPANKRSWMVPAVLMFIVLISAVGAFLGLR